MTGSTVNPEASLAGKVRRLRKDARGKRTRGLNDATVANGLLNSEGREDARDYDEDEGVGHPASGADTPPEAKRIVDCSWDARIDVGIGEALGLERERVWEQPVVVQDTPDIL
jgi:hypothetical protein